MLLKIISIVGSFTFFSRILGYTRDLLIARVVGAGLISDCFFIAFKLPNLFRRLFGEGAMNSAFIPVVSGINAKSGKRQSDDFFSRIFSILLVIFVSDPRSAVQCSQSPCYASFRCLSARMQGLLHCTPNGANI